MKLVAKDFRVAGSMMRSTAKVVGTMAGARPGKGIGKHGEAHRNLRRWLHSYSSTIFPNRASSFSEDMSQPNRLNARKLERT